MTGKAELLSPFRGHENPGNQGTRAMHLGPGLKAGEHMPGTRCARLGDDSTSSSSLWNGSLRGPIRIYWSFHSSVLTREKNTAPHQLNVGVGGGDSSGPF